jgi:hypothetical protein
MGNRIALDKGRSAYLTGSSSVIPTTSHSYEPESAYGGAFISKFAAADTTTIVPSVTKIISFGKNPQVSGVALNFALEVLPGPGSSLLTGFVKVSVDGSLVDTVSLEGVNGQLAFQVDPLAEGKHVIEADYSGDEHYSASSATYTQTIEGALGSISIVSGNGQTAQEYTAFPKPLVVIVKDTNGKPISDVPIVFTGPIDYSCVCSSFSTGTNGELSITANPEAVGQLTVTAMAQGTTQPSVVFSLTGTNP